MSTQISLSFELICLINWLLKHERAMLNAMIKQALDKGFAEELAKHDTTQQPSTEHLYHTIFDFLEFLEDALVRHFETVNLDNKTKDSIMPTLQKIEAGSIDIKTLWLTMQQAKARINKAHQRSGRANIRPNDDISHDLDIDQNEILFEQLLKNWKPNNKETLN